MATEMVVVVRTVPLNTCVCSYVCMRATNSNDLVQSAPDPSAGLPAGQNPYAYSLRRQVPGVPGANLNQPQGEEKGAEVRPPHPQLPRRQRAATLSIALTLEALGPDHHPPLDVISWLAGPV